MKKRIAIVTGATGGLGKEFVRLMEQEDIKEIWALARNKEKLENLRSEVGEKLRTVSLDLSDRTALQKFEMELKEQQPNIIYLVNNAGTARMGTYEDFTMEEMEHMVDLNCTSIVVLTKMCIPYMEKGSHILNLSSQASFQPDPYLNLYAASKAFLTSYSRSLNRELEKVGITVTAVCPGWVDTELLVKEVNHKKVKFPGLVSADKVAVKAMKDAKKGKDMSVCTAYVRFMQLFSKLMPHRLVMNVWIRSIDKYQ